MFKLIGILCILAGCIGWGQSKVREEKNRIRHLRELIGMIRRIQDEISYGKHTMPEICLILSEYCNMPYKLYFKQIYEQAGQERGIGIEQAWRQEMSKCLLNVPLTEEEKSIVANLLKNLGVREEKMQARNMGQSLDFLERKCRQAEEGFENKSRMILSVSVLAGVFLMILLV